MAEQLDNFVALKVFTKAKVVFEIGGKEFAMKPLTPKKLTILVQLVETSGKEMSELAGYKNAIEFVLSRIIEIFDLAFDEKIDQDFVNDNITIPLCIEVWEQFVKLNRLEGILPFFRDAIKITKTQVQPIKEGTI